MCCFSVCAAVRSLRLLVHGGLLCERKSGTPVDARQRRHDQSSEPCAHTRSLGHLQRGKTLMTYNVQSIWLHPEYDPS